MKHKPTYGQKKLDKLEVHESTISTVDELLASLKEELAKIKKINAVVLFGSFSRGDYSLRHSDIDIMIFLDETKKSADLEEKIRTIVIKRNIGVGISVHTLFQYRKVEEEDKSLMRTIAKEGKVLFARKTLVLSQNLLGIKPYVLLRFDTTSKQSIVKNKLQRFLYGYKAGGKQYKGIVDSETVIAAGQGAILVPEEMREKIMLFAKQIGVTVLQKAKLYR